MKMIYSRRKNKRFVSLLCAATEFNINPQLKLINDASIKVAAKIAVGNLGTNPVSKNSKTTGMPTPSEILYKQTLTKVKNRNGCISLKKYMIALRIFQSSFIVFNLLIVPSIRFI